jgi:hypothetical protein
MLVEGIPGCGIALFFIYPLIKLFMEKKIKTLTLRTKLNEHGTSAYIHYVLEVDGGEVELQGDVKAIFAIVNILSKSAEKVSAEFEP